MLTVPRLTSPPLCTAFRHTAQIAEQVEALGSGIGVKAVVLVGGIDMMAQAIALGKRPHIVVGTPGRVVDHLSNTKVRKGVAGGGRGGRQKARGGGKGEGGGKGILLGQQGDKKTGGEGSNVPYIVAPACGVAN